MPYTEGELLAIEDDARTVLMGDHFDASHWLGLTIDLSRELRRQQEVRLGTPSARSVDPLWGRWEPAGVAKDPDAVITESNGEWGVTCRRCQEWTSLLPTRREAFAWFNLHRLVRHGGEAS